MRKLFLLLLAVLVLWVTFPLDLYAGPWTVNKNKLWTEVFTRYYTTKYYFDSNYKHHKWPDHGRGAIYDIEGKFEYGVSDDLNLLIGIPYTWSFWSNDWADTNQTWDWDNYRWEQDGDDDNPKHEGFKSCSVGAKYKFMAKPAVMAIQGKIFLQPQHVDRTVAPLLCEYGDGVEGRFLIGNSWKVFQGNQLYASMEFGYYWRTDWVGKSEYADYIPLFGEIGFAPWTWLMWQGEVDCVISNPNTGIVKDSYTWRTGPIIVLIGKGFNAVQKGEDNPDKGININVQFQYGRTFLGRGDPEDKNDPKQQWNWFDGSDKVSCAQEFIAKLQVLW